MDVLNHPTETIALDSQSNAQAQATLAAPGAAYRWRVTGVKASYSGAAVATPTRATIALNGQTFGVGVSTSDGWKESFVNPLVGAANGTVVLTLPAGGVGAVGDVVVMGYKEPVTPMPA